MSAAPPARTEEQLRRHFKVERELAQRLLQSTRSERSQLFSKLYDELFERVPDHPRLVRRETPEESRESVTRRFTLLEPHLDPGKKFLEFAPGDCRLTYEVSKHVSRAIAADISDQRSPGDTVPENFEFVTYDGYELAIAPGSIDLAFSYQFIEHLHPEDTALHFQQAYEILKPGGLYVFDTPHAFSGPHDISRYFSQSPEGFHLKEWTYNELFRLTRACGFSTCYTYRRRKPKMSNLFNTLVLGIEDSVRIIPKKIRHTLSQRLFLGVTMLAVK